MMISKKEWNVCYVWIWLPLAKEPIVGGKLSIVKNKILFNYGRHYLDNKHAIAIYDKELPLRSGVFSSSTMMPGGLPRCIQDSAPDAWGRRVILNKLLGLSGKEADTDKLNELTYLIESGTDRIGALDFQLSSTEYQPRLSSNAHLEELLQSAARLEKGEILTPALDQALCHGTSVGGARPKALIDENQKKYIAKFSSSTDIYNIIKAEFVAMRLAQACGLHVAQVKLVKSLGKDVLLVERFDREYIDNGWIRKQILSALTLMELDEMGARYARYQDFAEIIRSRFTSPKATLKEIFSRLVFNILCSNTDDHARNHAAFWDGKNLTLTPAYDICPQLRMGGESTQAMIVSENDRTSKLKTCLAAAHYFMLTPTEAKEIIAHQIEVIQNKWTEIIEEADLNIADKTMFGQRLFFNSYAFEDFELSRPQLKV